MERVESGTDIALPVFTAPDLPAGLTALGKNGALNTLFDLVKVMKTCPGYTEAIGQDLGIIGGAQNGPDPATLQPLLTATVGASAVEIGWGWQGYAAFLDQIEIQVDRGDNAGWQMLTYDTTPGYNDTTPHPAALTRWKYRAIYRVDDLRVGLWSAEVSVTVGCCGGRGGKSATRSVAWKASGPVPWGSRAALFVVWEGGGNFTEAHELKGRT